MQPNSLLRYFDINSKLKAKRAQAVSASDDGQRTLHWIPQWLILLVGIWIQPNFEAYRVTEQWHWTGATGRLLFAAITALIVFPAIYRALVEANKPLPILLAPCFIGGLGYEALLATALKGATQVAGN